MTKTQLKLVGDLLSKAGRKFGNHGCNDYCLREDAGLTDTEIAEVEESLREYDDAVNCGDHIPVSDGFASDFVLMFWLALLAKKEAESA